MAEDIWLINALDNNKDITMHDCHTQKKHKTVLIIFPLILRTIIIAQMLSIMSER